MTGRILSSDQFGPLREHARDVLINTFGRTMLIDQRWAEQAGRYCGEWLAEEMVEAFIPMNWWDIYFEVRKPYIHSDRWDQICFAIFAALYVEAGKP